MFEASDIKYIENQPFAHAIYNDIVNLLGDEVDLHLKSLKCIANFLKSLPPIKRPNVILFVGKWIIFRIRFKSQYISIFFKEGVMSIESKVISKVSGVEVKTISIDFGDVVVDEFSYIINSVDYFGFMFL